mgnify:FL=1
MAVTAQLVKELREMTGAGMMDCKKALVETDGDIDKAVEVLREKGLGKAAKKADRVAAQGLVATKVAESGDKAAIIEVNAETDFVAKNEDFVGFVQKLNELVLEGSFESVDEFEASKFDGDTTVKEELTEKIATIGENMNIRRFESLGEAGCVYASYVHGNGKIAVLVEMKTDAAASEVMELGKDVAMQVASMNPAYNTREDVDADYIAREKEIILKQALNENEQAAKPKPEEIVTKIAEGRLNKQLKEVCLQEQAFVKDSSMTVAEYINSKAKEIGKDVKVTKTVRYEVGEGIEVKEEDFAEEVAKQMS